MSNFFGKLGHREWLIALSGAKRGTYLNHCASSNAHKLILSCGPILKCANLDVGPDTGPSTNENLGTDLNDGLSVNNTLDFVIDHGINTSFVNEEHSVNSGNGSVSWSEFVPSIIWYNNSPYMLYESLIDSTPTANLGYYFISRYNVDDFKHYEASGLLDCIMNSYYDFISVIIVTLFCIWKFTDFIFWMIINRFNTAIYLSITNMNF